jgi:hypothetical protein
MFASAGTGYYIEPPLHANWGGRNVHLGDEVYADFNLTLVDDGHRRRQHGDPRSAGRRGGGGHILPRRPRDR